MIDENQYLLLTPGPLTTSLTVRQAMLRDLSTWDVDYNAIVERVRNQLSQMASSFPDVTCVLMPGSGTFSVEAVIGSVIPPGGKLLVVNNGAYGERIAKIARYLHIPLVEIVQPEVEPASLAKIEQALDHEPDITHVAVVHCETTTGMLNPVEAIGQLAKARGKTYIVDAMSSFGGIPLTLESVGADFLISSANKCVQGVPGFGFVVMRRDAIEATKGWARSLSLDLYDQWREMDQKGGKWRFTSPTHVVCAFAQALAELQAEGGVAARHRRYRENHARLVSGMISLGFSCLLPPEYQSPIITSFYSPADPRYQFDSFYQLLKTRGFVIYPGKVTQAETFRIGNIGHVFPEDFDRLIGCVAEVVRELGIENCSRNPLCLTTN